MDEQQQMDLAFKYSRVDPVSGNEVPPGSLPEEVRDDVPAMLSEGEYVVPADVLRYYGVKFFEDLRDKAKAEMSGMEAEGRTGQPMDDDMPFSMEELNVVDVEEDMPEMSTGGYVKGYAEGGVVYDPNVANMEVPDFLKNVNPFGGQNEEYKTFKNDAGMTMTVRYVNGKPTSYIPPGYKEESAASATITGVAPTNNTATKPSAAELERQRRIREGDFGGNADDNAPPGLDLSNMSMAELEGRVQGIENNNTLSGVVTNALSKSTLGMVAKALTGKSISEKALHDYRTEIIGRDEFLDSPQQSKARDLEQNMGLDRGDAIAMGQGLSGPDGGADTFGEDFGRAASHAENNPTGMTTGTGLTPDDVIGNMPGDVTKGGKDNNGEGEGASGTVICTALHNKGLLDSKVFELDAEYGKLVRTNNPELMDGYLKLATPFADYIQKDTIGAVAARYAVAPFARAWAYEMAHQMKPEVYKGNVLGKAIMAVGYPLCKFVGKNKQEQAHAV